MSKLANRFGLNYKVTVNSIGVLIILSQPKTIEPIWKFWAVDHERASKALWL